jgi:hypothetical protein
MSSWPLPVEGRRVFMTLHALERYGERVRPHLSAYAQIHQDAARLVECAGVLSDTAPDWVNESWYRDNDTDPRGWLICGDVCFPLAEDREKRGRLVALTTFTRGGISEAARSARNRRRSLRTNAKRKRNKMEDRMMRGHNPRKMAAEFDA